MIDVLPKVIMLFLSMCVDLVAVEAVRFSNDYLQYSLAELIFQCYPFLLNKHSFDQNAVHNLVFRYDRPEERPS